MRAGLHAATAAALTLAAAPPADAQDRCAAAAIVRATSEGWPERGIALVSGGQYRRFGGSAAWRIGGAGVELCAGRLQDTRETRYRIGLVAPVWRRYGPLIAAAAARHGVPAELILTAIIEESGGRAHAIVHYPGYVSDAATPHKVSVGLGQPLISTAQRVVPERRVSRAWLLDPANGIDVIARYFAFHYAATGFDPPLAASAYNAGGLHRGAGNRWGVPNPRYVESFVAVFNASLAHLAAQPDRPAVSFAALLAAPAPAAPQPRDVRFGR